MQTIKRLQEMHLEMGQRCEQLQLRAIHLERYSSKGTFITRRIPLQEEITKSNAPTPY